MGTLMCASISYPNDFNALGDTPENVTQLGANFDAITDQVNGNIDGTNLVSGLRSQLGISSDSTEVRRGKFVRDANDSTGSASYTLLATPDRVQSVVLPTDGLLVVWYSARWYVSGGLASAGLFLGATQVQTWAASTGSVAVETTTNTTTTDGSTVYSSGNLVASSGVAGLPDRSTTGHALGSSSGTAFAPIVIIAAAGTYDVSLRFKNSGGTVVVGQRRLYVEAHGY